MTRSIFYLSLLNLMVLFPMMSHAEPEADTEVMEAKMAMKTLGGELMKALKQAMAEGGPTAAIKVCNIEAPAIAKAVSEQHGWKVGRTSLKVRNPNNAPDEWETQVLQTFEQRKAQGEEVASLEHIETTDSSVRFMKAIPTKGVCLTCHGSEIQPELSAELKRLYPDDKATGFKLGDIRGAFTLVKTN